MTLPPFPGILATTALCLAAMGVSSCVSQNCRSIWRGAYEVDKVWWIEGVRDNTTPIYRYNGDYFVLGKMGPAKGTLKSPGSVFERNYYPILEKAEPAYLRLDEESALLVKASYTAKSSGATDGNIPQKPGATSHVPATGSATPACCGIHCTGTEENILRNRKAGGFCPFYFRKILALPPKHTHSRCG